MRVSKWGRIINVASEDGITCSAICPGYVYTPLVEAQIEDQAEHTISARARRPRRIARQPAKQALRHGQGDGRGRPFPDK